MPAGNDVRPTPDPDDELVSLGVDELDNCRLDADGLRSPTEDWVAAQVAAQAATEAPLRAEARAAEMARLERARQAQEEQAAADAVRRADSERRRAAEEARHIALERRRFEQEQEQEQGFGRERLKRIDEASRLAERVDDGCPLHPGSRTVRGFGRTERWPTLPVLRRAGGTTEPVAVVVRLCTLGAAPAASPTSSPTPSTGDQRLREGSERRLGSYADRRRMEGPSDSGGLWGMVLGLRRCG